MGNHLRITELFVCCSNFFVPVRLYGTALGHGGNRDQNHSRVRDCVLWDIYRELTVCKFTYRKLTIDIPGRQNKMTTLTSFFRKSSSLK